MENNKNTECKNCKMKVTKKRSAKKVITIITLVAALGLTGVGIKKHIDSKPTYTINEETKRNELEGTIAFDQLNKYSLFTIIDLNGEEKYIIGKSTIDGVYDLSNGNRYSITSNKYVTSEVRIAKEESLDDYLITLDYIQQLYDADDLTKIYEAIVEYKANNPSVEKTLSK